jgi:hypothetical protein
MVPSPTATRIFANLLFFLGSADRGADGATQSRPKDCLSETVGCLTESAGGVVRRLPVVAALFLGYSTANAPRAVLSPKVHGQVCATVAEGLLREGQAGCHGNRTAAETAEK